MADIEIERARLELDRARPVYDAGIRFAEMTVRSLLILNGGAALALFTIAGNADKIGVKPQIAELSWMAVCFAAGAALAVSTAFLSYVAQTVYVEVQPHERATRIGNRVRKGVVVFGLLSMTAFIVGVWRSTYLFVLISAAAP